MLNPIAAAKNIGKANKALASEVQIIQGFANCIKEQPEINYQENPFLKKYANTINPGLSLAKAHADRYLKHIQPELIQNIDNISNYYAVHNAIVTSTTKENTKQKWVESLSYLRKMSVRYQGVAKNTYDMIEKLGDELNKDLSFFQEITLYLYDDFNGLKGSLKELNDNLDELQNERDKYQDGIIAAGVIEGLSIVLIGIGTTRIKFLEGREFLGKIVRYGGCVLCVLGLAGLAITGGAMIGLDKEIAIKNNQISLNKTELQLITGISSTYKTLTKRITKAIVATHNLRNAWQLLEVDLTAMIDNINDGSLQPDQAHALLLNAKNTIIKRITIDIKTIKSQLNGVTIINAKPDQSLEDTVSKIIQSTAV